MLPWRWFYRVEAEQLLDRAAELGLQAFCAAPPDLYGRLVVIPTEGIGIGHCKIPALPGIRPTARHCGRRFQQFGAT